MYKIIKKILFSLDPEKAHNLVLKALNLFGKLPGFLFLVRLIYDRSNKNSSCSFANLDFKNKVGLAAGFDKNAEAVRELAAFGFSFIEIGAVTPKPQEGNPRPRVFRLVKDRALINRMGFNNRGMDEIYNNLSKVRVPGIVLGCNIGKNKDTPLDQAYKDYVLLVRKLAPVVDYFAINVSSPNTPALRALQGRELLSTLLSHIREANQQSNHQRPIFLKLSPDLNLSEVESIVDTALQHGVVGLIIANTTTTRPEEHASKQHLIDQAGGLSGAPLFISTLELVSRVHRHSQGALRIIASGGIFSQAEAQKMFQAGADLIQIYTSFVYKGPALVRELSKL